MPNQEGKAARRRVEPDVLARGPEETDDALAGAVRGGRLRGARDGDGDPASRGQWPADALSQDGRRQVRGRGGERVRERPIGGGGGGRERALQHQSRGRGERDRDHLAGPRVAARASRGYASSVRRGGVARGPAPPRRLHPAIHRVAGRRERGDSGHGEQRELVRRRPPDEAALAAEQGLLGSRTLLRTQQESSSFFCLVCSPRALMLLTYLFDS